jgi:iron complex transport system permease protein
MGLLSSAGGTPDGRRGLALAVLTGALVVAALANAVHGATDVAPLHVVGVLLRHLGLDVVGGITDQEDAVIWSIRLPRLLLATLVGAGLATAGALLQGVFRNPLSEPSVIGVSSGAAVGAVAAIVFGLGQYGAGVLPLAAFVGAGLATAAVYVCGRADTVTLVLSGVAVNVLASAATGVLTYLADDQQLRDIVFWTLGSAGSATWPVVGSAVIPIGAAVLAAPLLARQLDVLALGEREAGHVGVDVTRLRLMAVTLAALATGGAVATAGMVGFVGLMAPHLVRLVVGPAHRALLVLSAMGGAVLVLVADLFARTIAAPRELPLGVVTALIGGPYLLWLLRRSRAEVALLWG